MNRDFLREHSIEIGYTILGLLVFFVFFVVTFPYADALSGVLAPTGLTVTNSGQSFALPLGVKMIDFRISDTGAGGPPLFQSDQVRVAPALLPMLLGSPGINLHADAYGGRIAISARRSGDATAFKFNASDMHLEQLRALRIVTATFGGIIQSDGNLTLSQRDMSADQGTMHISGNDTSIRLLPGSPPLKLGALSGNLTLTGQKLDVQQLETHGGDLTISGRGVVEIEPNLSDSPVAIHFQLQTTPAGASRLGFIMNLLPHPPGPAPYFLHGTLGAPQLS